MISDSGRSNFLDKVLHQVLHLHQTILIDEKKCFDHVQWNQWYQRIRPI